MACREADRGVRARELSGSDTETAFAGSICHRMACRPAGATEKDASLQKGLGDKSFVACRGQCCPWARLAGVTSLEGAHVRLGSSHLLTLCFPWHC